MESLMNPLGRVVYLRTYSRFLEDKQRRETWPETVKRVVDYSASLAKVEEQEKLKLYDTFLHLRGFPAGRTLWAGGTPFIAQNGQANYNCAFTDLRTGKDFYDLVILLMSGAGVGFRVTRDNIEALNQNLPIRRVPKLHVLPYEFYGYGHPLYTERSFIKRMGREATLVVGDSREGWAEAVKLFLELLGDRHVELLHVNLNSVRPLGSPLKRFGGFASGPGPLEDFFLNAAFILGGTKPEGWTDVKALDVANLIGRMVVAGGTRRSAQISLGDWDSKNFIAAKTGNWWATAPWRAQSNNSVLFYAKPDRDTLLAFFDAVLQYGEPGFVNAQTALKRREDFRGVNPCSEILLRNKGVCNLTTVVLPNHVRNGKVDYALLEDTLRLLTRHAIRITTAQFPDVLSEWQRVQDEDRLIGVSFTGLDDFIHLTGLDNDALAKVLAWMRSVVNDEAKRYSAELGLPKPKLATTVKPEGTLSLLAGVSSGVHPAYAPYYIRRVRINKHDSVAQALRALGMEPKPEVGYDSLDTADVWVFEFPVKTNAKRKAHDYTAVEQLERYKLVNSVYTEHNTSITVYVAPEEKEEVVDWLLQNWDHYVAVSFLPKDDSAYPLMPFETISEEEYNALVAKLPDFSTLDEDVAFYDRLGGLMGDDIDPSCATGACPVR
ncbi:ribonucleotide reductase [Thermus phage P74-26]|uniref:Ribonucleoside-triphosphate reductase n=1 Tax=Thermus phage P74-26 TaxID=2914007 RepID=A7XXH5_BP742|nr:ribonucleotide reductase [Thermus phage P74-26]ABU96963.1 ribonucleoside-triphosphate reductase [Thermus phage P74-26]